MQDLAGDEAGILQIEDRVDDVVDLPETTDRMQFRQRVVGRRIVHRRADYPEGNSVRAKVCLERLVQQRNSQIKRLVRSDFDADSGAV